MTEGLDVYGRYNNVTNWGSVNGVKDFVWIKISDGTTLKNALGVNYDYGYVGAARTAGLPAGAYHYAQLGDPVQQANLFIDRAEALGATDISPMLDLESPFVANQAAIDFAIAFCKRVLQRGHKPTLYANNSMMLTVRNPFKAQVPDSYICVARYGANPTVTWDNWQFTSSGSCSGVVGNVDLDTGIFPANKGHDMEADERAALFALRDSLVTAHTSKVAGSSAAYPTEEFVRFNNANLYNLTVTTMPALMAAITASDANDVTAQQIATALVPMILPTLEQGIQDAVTDLPDLDITPEQMSAIASATALKIGQALTGETPA